jgi:hypothetical protein
VSSVVEDRERSLPTLLGVVSPILRAVDVTEKKMKVAFAELGKVSDWWDESYFHLISTSLIPVFSS